MTTQITDPKLSDGGVLVGGNVAVVLVMIAALSTAPGAAGSLRVSL